MKKIILVLTMMLSLGMASLGFASPASDLLSQEENAVTKMVALLQGKGTYEEVSGSFAPELKKNFPETAVANLQRGVKTQLGSISDVKLARLDKFPTADRLIYLGKAQKAPNVQLVFVFETKGKKALMQIMNVAPVEVKQTPAQQAAK